MKKNTTAVIAAGLCLASIAVSAGPKAEDFKVRLTAVAVADAGKDELKTKRFPPETRIVVTPESSTPKGFTDNFDEALILDGDGNRIGKTGYRQGGAAEYVKHLKSFRKK